MARLKHSVSTLRTTTVGQLALFIYTWTGTPQARFYKVGDTPPAFTNMTFDAPNSRYTKTDNTVTPGVWIIEYKDSAYPAGTQLSRTAILNPASEGCFSPDTSYQEVYAIVDTGLRVVGNHSSSGGTPNVATSAYSIDGGVTFKNHDTSSGTCFFSNAELIAAGKQYGIPTIIRKRLSNGCTDSLHTNIFIESPPTATASFTKTDCTANGADDGTINVTVSGGSGSFSFLWDDGPTTQNRTALGPDAYHVTITDDVTLQEIELDIEITEPAPAPTPQGTYFSMSAIQSLRFVVNPAIVNNCTIFQNFDNTLFCNMRFYKGMRKSYYNPVCICDSFPVQYKSDFPLHSVTLHKQSDNTIIKTFSSELKLQLIGLSETFGVTISNHGAGQSRVYFNVGAIPLPLNVGDVFEVINNGDGFNGNYAIIDIQDDELVGSQYLVINKNYIIPAPSTAADAVFLTNVVPFNIYEAVLSFSDVPAGQYYVKILASDLDTAIPAFSEPIDLRAEHPHTNFVVMRNSDNDADLVFTTGFYIQMRVPTQFYKPKSTGKTDAWRNTDYTLNNLSSKRARCFLLEAFEVPFYIHETLLVGLGMDFKSVNGVEYRTEEAYAQPTERTRYPLTNSSIILEQARWFTDYNGDDLGTVEQETGFWITETGFVKR